MTLPPTLKPPIVTFEGSALVTSSPVRFTPEASMTTWFVPLTSAVSPLPMIGMLDRLSSPCKRTWPPESGSPGWLRREVAEREFAVGNLDLNRIRGIECDAPCALQLGQSEGDREPGPGALPDRDRQRLAALDRDGAELDVADGKRKLGRVGLERERAFVEEVVVELELQKRLEDLLAFRLVSDGDRVAR